MIAKNQLHLNRLKDDFFYFIGMIFSRGGIVNRLWLCPDAGGRFSFQLRIDQAQLNREMDSFNRPVEIQFFHDLGAVGFDCG